VTQTLVLSANPTQPEDVVCTVPATTADEARTAVDRLRAVQEQWAQRPAQGRSTALIEAAERLAAEATRFADLIVREVGKPVTEARGEVTRAVDILRYASQQSLDENGATHQNPAGLTFTQRRPRGVAGLITPWNFPLAIPLWKAAPALAHGNTVALKPAPQATAVAVALAELFRDGVVEVLPGFVDTASALVDATDVVSFTGSVAAGQQVVSRAVSQGTPVQAEMGGCNATVVLPDADLDVVARDLIASCFGFAGQKCTATQRIVVVGDPSPLLKRLRELLDTVAVGDPTDAQTVVGPVVDAAAQQRLAAAGCDVLDRPGFFVAPTLVETDDPAHLLLNEEVFGPIAAVLAVDSVAAAFEVAGSGRYGLVTSIYTSDLSAALAAVRSSSTGLVRVNQPTTGVDLHLPFGGQRSSSHGPREQGRAAREHYTWLQTVSLAGLS
jgi:acyl-CoA reductase-like NAD-dependent aldehyde dehydrogenase